MRRTELLQENRKMRFEEVYGGWQKKRLSQEEAATILGVCSRTFRRQICRYEENSLEGLNDKRLTQASHRRAPVDEVMALMSNTESGIVAGALNIFTRGIQEKAASVVIPG